MGKRNNKTTFVQRSLLVVFGIFLGLILVECILRMGGIITLSFQESRNARSIKLEGPYRVLCLGESTTAFWGRNSYPRQLEDILNKNDQGLKFSVINKGVPGTDTMQILSNLEYNLNKYRPDIVVTMMGINDNYSSEFREDVSKEKCSWSIESFRTYKLFRLIISLVVDRNIIEDVRITDYVEERERINSFIEMDPRDLEAYSEFEEYHWEQGDFEKIEDVLLRAIARYPDGIFAHNELAEFYWEQGDYDDAERILIKSIELNPKNIEVYAQLRRHYEVLGELERFVDVLNEIIKLDPSNYWAYMSLRDHYSRLGYDHKAQMILKRIVDIGSIGNNMNFELGEDVQFEDMLKEAIESNPEDYRLYLTLGEYYDDKEEYEKVENILQVAVRENPSNYEVFDELAEYYEDIGEYDKLGELFMKTTEANPENYRILVDWARFLRNRGYYDKAEKVLKKVVRMNPKDKGIYNEVKALLYEKQVSRELSIGNLRRKDGRGSEYNNPVTRYNYQILKDKVLKRGIKLVVVQYPMRSVEPLEKVLTPIDGDKFVIVDNEEIFKKALDMSDYFDYFSDDFAGDFGHCTTKGNKLLADNVADVILNKFFN